MLITSQDLYKFLPSADLKKLTEHYFLLGLSIAKILLLPSGTATIRAFSQLMEEWEYHLSGGSYISRKYMMAKTSPCVYPNTVPIEGLSDLTRPNLYKFNNTIVYEFLQVHTIAFELDYREVVIQLSNTFLQLYDKFFHQECFR